MLNYYARLKNIEIHFQKYVHHLHELMFIFNFSYYSAYTSD